MSEEHGMYQAHRPHFVEGPTDPDSSVTRGLDAVTSASNHYLELRLVLRDKLAPVLKPEVERNEKDRAEISRVLPPGCDLGRDLDLKADQFRIGNLDLVELIERIDL